MTETTHPQGLALGENSEIRVLYDGGCPLCEREISMLRRLDRGRRRIDFEDIAAPRFDPERYGLDQEQVMARIHAVLPDGSVIEGVDVFRRAYAAVGLGWLVAPTRWPLLRGVSEAAYRVFARNRLRWTGRQEVCADGVCSIPPSEHSQARTAGEVSS
jgi:predicted DCC family thiol-disulfide oxidoreductase YuxK